MTPVEQSLRNALSKSPSASTEDRNRIYLSAREAINRLPDHQTEQALKDLFDAIKAIETDYVREELSRDVEQPRAEPEEVASGDDQGQPTPPAQEPPRPARPRIPWVTLAIVLLLFTVMGISAYLLWSQFEKRDLVLREPPPVQRIATA